MPKPGVSEDFLSERQRAEDILLGSLGFAEEAKLESVIRSADGYRGVGRFPDGEQFTFESDDLLDELQLWALDVLLGPAA